MLIVNKEYKNLGLKLTYINTNFHVYGIVVINSHIFKEVCLVRLYHFLFNNRHLFNHNVDSRLSHLENIKRGIKIGQKMYLYKGEFSFLEKINREVKIKDIKNE